MKKIWRKRISIVSMCLLLLSTVYLPAIAAPIASSAHAGVVSRGGGGAPAFSGHSALPASAFTRMASLSISTHTTTALGALLLRGAPTLPSNFALDLTSTSATLAATNTRALQIFTGGVITHGSVRGGLAETITPGELLTPAQYVALGQVMATGHQSLELNATGSASGGYLTLSAKDVSGLSALDVPSHVVVDTIGFNARTPLMVNGSATVNGSLYSLQLSKGITAVMDLSSLTIGAGGLVSASLPAGARQMAGVQASAGMTLNIAGDLNNQGTISSPGLVAINTGGGIYNQSAPGFAAASIAGETVSLSTGSGNIVNSGIVSASTGNINLASLSNATFEIANAAGTLSAPNGSVNLRDSNYNGTADTNLTGGNVLSQSVNVYSGQGVTNIDVENLTGTVNANGYGVHVAASTSALTLGNINAVDPTFYNDNGDIDINGDVTIITGEALTVVASGNITTTSGGTSLTISTNNNSNNQGYDINLIAGAQLSAMPPCSGCVPTTTLPGGNQTPGSITITGPSSSGGNIDLHLFTGGVTLNSSSTGVNSNGLGENGGNVNLIAFAGSGGGNVILPAASSIMTGGADGSNGLATNGNVTVIAGAPSGTSVQMGGTQIETANGTAGGGAVSIFTSQPSVSGSGVVAQPNGQLTGAFSPTVSGANVQFTPAGASVGGIFSAGEVMVMAGGAVTAGHITVLNNPYGSVLAGTGVVLAAGAGQSGSSSNLMLNSGVTANGLAIYMAATGNINASAVIDSSSTYSSGGAVAIFAGANSTYTISPTGTLNVTGPSQLGGNLALASGQAVNTYSTADQGSGGAVQLSAFAGPSTNGTITAGNVSAGGTASGGIVAITAGGMGVPTSTVIALGNVDTTGGAALPSPTSGTITIATQQPVATQLDTSTSATFVPDPFNTSPLSNAGGVSFGNLSAPGAAVEVLAGGNIASTGANGVSASSLLIYSTSGSVGLSGPIMTNVNTIQVYGPGTVNVSNSGTNPLTLAPFPNGFPTTSSNSFSISTNGDLQVNVSVNSMNINLTTISNSGGSIYLNANIMSTSSAGSVSLNADGSIFTTGTTMVDTPGTLSLSATNGDIGGTGVVTSPLAFSALNVSANAGGSVYLTSQGPVNFVPGQSSSGSSSGGDFQVVSTGAMSITGDVNAGGLLYLGAAGGINSSGGALFGQGVVLANSSSGSINVSSSITAQGAVVVQNASGPVFVGSIQSEGFNVSLVSLTGPVTLGGDIATSGPDFPGGSLLVYAGGSGAPIFTSGSQVTTGGGNVAMVAGGTIGVGGSGQLNIDTSGGTQGGNVYLSSGAVSSSPAISINILTLGGGSLLATAVTTTISPVIVNSIHWIVVSPPDLTVTSGQLVSTGPALTPVTVLASGFNNSSPTISPSQIPGGGFNGFNNTGTVTLTDDTLFSFSAMVPLSARAFGTIGTIKDNGNANLVMIAPSISTIADTNSVTVGGSISIFAGTFTLNGSATQSLTLNAGSGSTTGGSIFVPLASINSSSGGSINMHATSGSLDPGNILLGGIGNLSGTVSLTTTSGNITQMSVLPSANLLSAGTLTLVSTSGFLGPLATQVNNLSASTSADVVVANYNSDVNITGGSANNFTVANNQTTGVNGSITVSGPINAQGNVSLETTSQATAANPAIMVNAAITAGGDLTLQTSGPASGISISQPVTSGGNITLSVLNGSGEVYVAVNGLDPMTPQVLASGGTITVTAASVDFEGIVDAGSNPGNVLLLPNSNSEQILLGSAGAPVSGSFNVSSTSLGNIIATNVTIGSSAGSGGILLAGNITVPEGDNPGIGPGVYNFDLENGGAGGSYNGSGFGIDLDCSSLIINVSGTLQTGTGLLTGQRDTVSLTGSNVLVQGMVTLVQDDLVTLDGTLNVTATGNGGIQQSSGGLLLGQYLNLSSAGNIGTTGSIPVPISTNAAYLTVNSVGSVNIANTGAGSLLTVNQSVVSGVGSTLSISTLGQMSVSDSVSALGAITLQSGDNMSISASVLSPTSVTISGTSVDLQAPVTVVDGDYIPQGSVTITATDPAGSITNTTAGAVTTALLVLSAGTGGIAGDVMDTGFATSVFNLAATSTGNVFVNNANAPAALNIVSAPGVGTNAGASFTVYNDQDIVVSGPIQASNNLSLTTFNNGNITVGAAINGVQGVFLSANGTGAVSNTAGGTITAENSTITLLGGSIVLIGNGTVNAGTGTVILSPSTSTSIFVAASGHTPGEFDITNSELGAVVAQTLQIGLASDPSNPPQGAISVVGPLTIASGSAGSTPGVYDLDFEGTAFTNSGNAINMQGQNLTVNVGGAVTTDTISGSGGTFNITGTSVALTNDIINLSGTVNITANGSSPSNSITQSAGALSAGTVSLATGAGAINETSGGPLLVNANALNISTANGIASVTNGINTVSSLTATITAGGQVTVNESASVMLNSSSLSSGTLKVFGVGDIDTTGTISGGSGSSLTLTAQNGGNIEIGAQPSDSLVADTVSLVVNGSGGISQNGSLAANQSLSLSVADGSATLTNSAGGASTLVGSVTGGGSLSVTETGPVSVSASGLGTGSMDVTANSNSPNMVTTSTLAGGLLKVVSQGNLISLGSILGNTGSELDLEIASGSNSAIQVGTVNVPTVVLTAGASASNISQASGKSLIASNSLTVNLGGGTADLTTGTSNNIASLSGTGTGLLSLNNAGNTIQLRSFASGLNVNVTAGVITTGSVDTNVGALTLSGTTITFSESMNAGSNPVILTASASGTAISQSSSAALIGSTLTLHLIGTGTATADLSTAANSFSSLTATDVGSTANVDLNNTSLAFALNGFTNINNLNVSSAGNVTTPLAVTVGGTLTLSADTYAITNNLSSSGLMSLTAHSALSPSSIQAVLSANGAGVDLVSNAGGFSEGAGGAVGTANFAEPLLLTLSNGGSVSLTQTSPGNNISKLSGTGSGSVTLNNNGNAIQLNSFGSGVNVNVTAGAITTGTVSTSVGSLTLSGTSISFSEAMNASGNPVSLTASGSGTAISQSSSAALTGGTLTLTLSNAGTVTADLSQAANSFSSLSASGALSSTTNVNLNNGTSGLALNGFTNVNNLDVNGAGAITTMASVNLGGSLTLSGTSMLFSKSVNVGANTISLTASGLGTAISQSASLTGGQLMLSLTGVGTVTADLSTNANSVTSLYASGAVSSTTNVLLNNGTTGLNLGTFTNINSLNVTSAGAITTLNSGTVVSLGTLALTGTTIAFSEPFSTTGTMSLTASNSNGNVITQTASSNLSALGGLTVNLSGGTALLNTSTANRISQLTGTGSGSINLNNGGNDIQLNTFGSNENLTVTNAGAITTGATGTNMTALDLSGTSIVLSETIIATGAVTLSASGGGNISQTSGTLTAPTSLTVTTGSGIATLANSATGTTTLTGNTTSGTLNITESGATLVSSTGLGSGTLNVTAGGDLTTSGTISGNAGSVLNLQTTTVSNGSITLGNVSADTVTVNAGGSGNISQSGGTTLNASSALNVTTDNGSGTLVNGTGNSTTLSGVTNTGMLSITVTGPIMISTTGLGSGSMTVIGNGASAAVTTSNLGNGMLMVTEGGALSTTGSVTGANGSVLNLSTTAGSSGSIQLGNITVATVTLSAGGSGSISQAGSTTLSVTNTLNVTTGSGSATLTNITTGATTLTGSTGTGALNVTESGPVSLSTAGLGSGSMTVSALGATASVGTSNLASGTLQVTASGDLSTTGTIMGAAGSVLNLQTTAGSNGSIMLGMVSADSVSTDTVTLNAGGSGSIVQTGTLTASSALNVTTGSGSATLSNSAGGMTTLSASTVSGILTVAEGGATSISSTGIGAGELVVQASGDISTTGTISGGTGSELALSTTTASNFGVTLGNVSTDMVVISANGAITVSGNVSATTAAQLTDEDDISGPGTVSGNLVTIESNNGSIGTLGVQSLNVMAGTLSIDASNGNVFVTATSNSPTAPNVNLILGMAGNGPSNLFELNVGVQPTDPTTSLTLVSGNNISATSIQLNVSGDVIANLGTNYIQANGGSLSISSVTGSVMLNSGTFNAASGILVAAKNNIVLGNTGTVSMTAGTLAPSLNPMSTNLSDYDLTSINPTGNIVLESTRGTITSSDTNSVTLLALGNDVQVLGETGVTIGSATQLFAQGANAIVQTVSGSINFDPGAQVTAVARFTDSTHASYQGGGIVAWMGAAPSGETFDEYVQAQQAQMVLTPGKITQSGSVSVSSDSSVKAPNGGYIVFNASNFSGSINITNSSTITANGNVIAIDGGAPTSAGIVNVNGATFTSYGPANAPPPPPPPPPPGPPVTPTTPATPTPGNGGTTQNGNGSGAGSGSQGGGGNQGGAVGTQTTPQSQSVPAVVGQVVANGSVTPAVSTSENDVSFGQNTYTGNVTSLDSHTLGNLANSGIHLGEHNANFVQITQGNVFFQPDHDISVAVQEGSVYMPEGSAAYVMETGHDVAVFDIRDGRHGAAVKVKVGDKVITMRPGEQVVLTRQLNADFDQINPAKRVAYRNPHSELATADIRAYKADFSIPSVMMNAAPLRHMLASDRPMDRRIAHRILKNAVIVAQMTQAAGPYKTAANQP